MNELFGSDGIKGIANTELTAELALKLGRAGAYVLSKETTAPFKIIVGKDTRISGDMLEAALTAGLCSMGAQVISVGILPAPAVAYLTKKYKALAGVVVSASHKSMEYNGIKFFDNNGCKISEQSEELIEQYVFGEKEIENIPLGKNIGKISRVDTGKRDYVDYIKSTIDCNFDGFRIAIDCANGSAYECSKMAIKELGADVIIINNVPNGININENCGSAHMEGLCRFVTENKCDFGLAFDGDGHVVHAADEKGGIISNTQILSFCAESLSEQTFLPVNLSGDGPLTALQFCALLKKTGKKPTELGIDRKMV